MSWRETEFENLYAIPSKNGLTRPARVRGSGHKMINMGELFANDRIGNIKMELVPMNERELSSMLVEQGDLLFARQSLVLAGAGKCSIVSTVDEPTTFESHIIRVRLNRKVADPVFYHYYFKSPICRIRSIVTQGVQAGIRGNDLKKLRTHIPTLETQQRIASVLSAYEDLIENNRRRIQLLEQAARLLYKEWFIHLRFPGHEHVKIIGGVPEGWEKLRIGDVCTKIGSGATPRGGAASYQTEGISLIRSLNVYDYNFHDEGLVFINEQQADKLSNVTIESRDVLINITGASVARCCIAQDRHLPARVNQHVMILRPIQNKVCSEYLLCAINSERQKQLILSIARAGGATREALTKDTVANIQIVIPSSHLMTVFREFALKNFVQIETFQQHNVALSKARDLLLPRLMNGEIQA